MLILSYHMIMDQQIKVYYYSYGLERNKDPCFLLWMLIQEEMEKEGFSFHIYEETKEPDWDDMIDKISNGEYDIGISPFYYSEERRKKVFFTYPFSIMHASIRYHIPQNYFIIFFFKKVFNIILLLIFVAFIFSYLYYKIIKGKKFSDTFHYIFPSFFGVSSGIMNQNRSNYNIKYNGKLNIIINIFLYLFIFNISVTLLGLLIAKTLHFTSFQYKFTQLKGKKIIISIGNASIPILKSLGIIPIYYGPEEKKNYKNILDFYLKNYKKYDGVYTDGWQFLNNKSNNGILNYKMGNNNYLLHTSLLGDRNNLIGLPINKSKKRFVEKVNYYFMKYLFSDYGKICNYVVNNNDITVCPNIYLNPGAVKIKKN